VLLRALAIAGLERGPSRGRVARRVLRLAREDARQLLLVLDRASLKPQGLGQDAPRLDVLGIDRERVARGILGRVPLAGEEVDVRLRHPRVRRLGVELDRLLRGGLGVRALAEVREDDRAQRVRARLVRVERDRALDRPECVLLAAVHLVLADREQEHRARIVRLLDERLAKAPLRLGPAPLIDEQLGVDACGRGALAHFWIPRYASTSS
jgi:hypothetical protein